MQIAILLYDGFTALDAVGPYEVLPGIPDADVRFVAAQPGPVRADTRRLTLIADDALTDVPHPDLLHVPGGGEGTVAALEKDDILAWVRAAHETTQWTTSVCTGALILGAAGLLTGLEATTYWSAHAPLARFGATYKPERYVRQGTIITAAGVSAGIDMALFLVGQIAGAARAEAVQLAIEYDPAPPFDSGTFAKAMPETVMLARQVLRDRLRAIPERGQ